MLEFHHPVFGTFVSHPALFSAEEDAELDASRDAEMASFLVALDTIRTDRQVEIPEARQIPKRAFGPVPVPPYQGRIIADERGAWVEQPHGTAPGRGDEIDDDGVLWRLRQPKKPRAKTPRDAYDAAVRIAAEAYETLKEIEATNTEGSAELERARAIYDRLAEDRAAKLKAAEAWQDAGHDNEAPSAWGREWDVTTAEGRKARWNDIDAYRATPEGRAQRNAARRARETPNADLSAMTEDEVKARNAEKARLRKQKQRARDKAAASGDLAAAIGA